MEGTGFGLHLSMESQKKKGRERRRERGKERKREKERERDQLIPSCVYTLLLTSFILPIKAHPVIKTSTGINRPPHDRLPQAAPLARIQSLTLTAPRAGNTPLTVCPPLHRSFHDSRLNYLRWVHWLMGLDPRSGGCGGGLLVASEMVLLSSFFFSLLVDVCL